LEPLAARFRAFLAREIPTPHDASTQTLDYLDIKGIPSLYLRGEREKGGEPEWYVQLGFSGCAGMAEVSAAAATSAGPPRRSATRTAWCSKWTTR
jgi:hypothetical protein